MIRSLQKFKLLAADFGAGLLAWGCFYLLRKYLLSEINEGYRFTGDQLFTLTGSALMIAGFWVLLYALIGEYRDIFRKSRVGEIIRLARISFLGAVVIFFALLLDDQGVSNYRLYYKTISAYFLLHFTITAVLRTWAITSIQRLVRRRVISFNTLLVGSSPLALETFHELDRANRHLGLNIIGFVPVGDVVDPALALELPRRGSFERLPALVRALHIEHVVVALEPSEHQMIQQVLAQLEGTPARVSVLPDVYQILLGSVKVNHLFGTPLIEIKHDLLPVWQEVLKRLIDVVGSALFLALAWPVYAFTAVMVRLSSPGPIFFAQERIGIHGKPFKIYKFRSMYIDAERFGPALSSQNDPRITPWGRFMRKVRLDELPQFWNVIKGDMSLVGPRPERQFFIDQITKVAPHYRHLHRVRPGITSLGQVKYGYAETVEQMVQRLKYDILYIENMSLAMDFRVMLYTLKIIVEGRGK